MKRKLFSLLAAGVLTLAMSGGNLLACGPGGHGQKAATTAGKGHDHAAHAEKGGDHAAHKEGAEASCHAEGGEHAEHKACPMKDAGAAAEKVALTGKLVCMHCNLKKEADCRKVFQVADTLYDICPMSDVKGMEKVSNHGESTFEVKGHKMAKDGKTMLMIDSFEVKPAA